jgi:preprotein translocase subunit SecF
MGVARRMYRGETDFDFRRAWRVAAVASALLVAASVVSLLASGLNLGIDFKGGVAWEVPAPGVTAGEARSAVDAVGAGALKVQTIGADTLRVQAGPQSDEKVEQVRQALATLAGAEPTDVSVSTVGPSWGDEITDSAVRALVWFLIAIAVYIAVRLEWRMAVGALVALVHDIVISVGVYSVMRFEVTPATVVAFLTILGYSLYDTIVVFDKVHENRARRTRETYDVLMSRSLNEVLMRSINTTFTSLLPVISMLVVGSWILGAVTLGEFSIALAVGLLVGAYSSVCVAAPVVVLLHRRDPGEATRRERSSREQGEPGLVGSTASRSGAVGDGSEPAPPAVFSTGHPPRPRKQGKRR